LKENDGSLKSPKSNNENPFTTKSKLSRTPDNVFTKEGKSERLLPTTPIIKTTAPESIIKLTEKELIIPVINDWQDDKVVDIKDKEIQCEVIEATPVELTNAISESSPIAFLKVENFDEENINLDSNEQLNDEISCEMGNFLESDLDELSIDEVLMAFRDDAAAAEKAILMATTRGHLHPREFREYLKAFKSPTKPTPETEIDPNFSRIRSTLSKENHSVPTHYPRTDNTIISSSPKSSLLNMLAMADTPPINKSTDNDTSYRYSPATYSLPVKDPIKIITKQQEESKQFLRNRTEAMRLVVATAVASVTTLTSSSTSSAPTPSTSIVSISNPTLKVKPLVHSAIKVPLVHSAIKAPLVHSAIKVPVISIKQSAEIPVVEMGMEMEGFLPTKKLIRTPPKVNDFNSTVPIPIPLPLNVEENSKILSASKQDTDFVNIETEKSCINVNERIVVLNKSIDMITAPLENEGGEEMISSIDQKGLEMLVEVVPGKV
jgi:hypothetical protein